MCDLCKRLCLILQFCQQLKALGFGTNSLITFLSDETLNYHVSPGIHAIVSLNEKDHPSHWLKKKNRRKHRNINVNMQDGKMKRKTFHIVLFYWPINDAFTNIKRSNVSRLMEKRCRSYI